jgi:hypothetical protein
MQAEIDSAAVPTPKEIRILGLNRVGDESGNAAMCEGRSLPWLQDTEGQNAWGDWEVRYRDVVILDAQNVPQAVFNLTDYDLADSASYDSLRVLLLQIAAE